MTEDEMCDVAEGNIRADYRNGLISKERFQMEMLIVARSRPAHIRERLEREERHRQIQANVCLYQLMAICGVTVLAAVIVAVWAIARV